MEFTSELDKANAICTVYVTGEFRRPHDSDTLKQFAIDFYAKHQCRRYLFDLTQATVLSGTMSTFKAAAPRNEFTHTLRKFRTAFVRPALSGDDRFFETVSVNRGFQLRAFDTFENALEWLKQGE